MKKEGLVRPSFLCKTVLAWRERAAKTRRWCERSARKRSLPAPSEVRSGERSAQAKHSARSRTAVAIGAQRRRTLP